MKSGQPPPGVRRSRTSIGGSIRFELAGRAWESPIIDVSLTGMRSGFPEGFEAGEGASMSLALSLDSGESLRAQAVLVRLTPQALAFRFDPPLSPQAREVLSVTLADHGRLRDDVDDA